MPFTHPAWTMNLLAALNTATGEVLGRCFARRCTKEFLKFMDQVVTTYPGSTGQL
jgi:hypothetical protein